VNPLLEPAQGVIRAVDSGRPLRGDHDEITLLRWAIASATEREAAVEELVDAAELALACGSHSNPLCTTHAERLRAALVALSREVKDG
jgi:hypothetical protein